MARNEEEHILKVIEGIKNQKPVAPEKIFVMQDGSTDSTKDILDGIEGLNVEHIAPHSPLRGVEFIIKRNKLMWRAEKGTDYILCMDGDAYIQETYVHDIIKRMESDGVIAAHGFDKLDPCHTLVEAGMVIKTSWLRKCRVELPAINFIVCASVNGTRTAVYYDVSICYLRKTGTFHSTETHKLRGKHWKALGHSLVFVLYQSIRLRSTHYLRGYLKAGPCERNEFTEWIRKWERDIALHKILRKRSMCKRTQFANYVLPQKIDWSEHRDGYGLWKSLDA